MAERPDSFGVRADSSFGSSRIVGLMAVEGTGSAVTVTDTVPEAVNLMA